MHCAPSVSPSVMFGLREGGWEGHTYAGEAGVVLAAYVRV